MLFGLIFSCGALCFLQAVAAAAAPSIASASASSTVAAQSTDAATPTPTTFMVLPNLQVLNSEQATSDFEVTLNQTFGSENVGRVGDLGSVSVDQSGNPAYDAPWWIVLSIPGDIYAWAAKAGPALLDLIQDSTSTLDGFDDRSDNDWTQLLDSVEKRGIVRVDSSDAIRGLLMFSQPIGYALEFDADYEYSANPGLGSTIYLLDTGAELGHPEFSDLAVTPRWIYTTIKGRTPSDSARFNYHGTCMASLLVGQETGIAKNASLVIVKSDISDSSLVAGLYAIIKDVERQGLQGKAIVSISLTGVFGGVGSASWARARLYLDTLINTVNVTVVIAAGNNRDGRVSQPPSANVDSYPALWAAELPLIIAGSVGVDGEESSYSQGGPLVSAFAPDFGFCASLSQNYYQYNAARGTSFAAALTAALAAYFLGLTSLKGVLQPTPDIPAAQQMKAFISDSSAPRSWGGPPVVRNLQQGQLRATHGALLEGFPLGPISAFDADSGSPFRVSQNLSVVPASAIPSCFWDDRHGSVFVSASAAAGPGSIRFLNSCTDGYYQLLLRWNNGSSAVLGPGPLNAFSMSIQDVAVENATYVVLAQKIGILAL